jgi:hypothetical protein
MLFFYVNKNTKWGKKKQRIKKTKEQKKAKKRKKEQRTLS